MSNIVAHRRIQHMYFPTFVPLLEDSVELVVAKMYVREGSCSVQSYFEQKIESPLLNPGIQSLNSLKNGIICGRIQHMLSMQVGAEAEYGRIEFLLSEVKGKDITELIASGREKFASVPSGGGAVAVAAPAGGGGGVASAPAAAETKKEEKVEEKEESDDDMGFSLFD